ncbi:MAG: hypothetical protein PWQ84_1679 [Thermotogaceae bacterium]|nr:hypothetical protein [Thermotogaceae bacterium]
MKLPKKYLIITLLLLFLSLLCLSKQLVIIFKDGTKVVYNIDQIEEFYVENGDNVFSTLEGEWQGDRGIKSCYINESGLFSIQMMNGYAWSGYCQFENGYLMLETPYPIPVEYMLNYNIPVNIAKEARKVIERADRWIFTITGNGMKLEGQKRNFRLRWNNNRLLDIEYVEREAVWERK